MQPPRHGSVRVDHRRGVSTDSLFREVYDDSEDEDDEVGYADPVQDDLYARKMGIKPLPTSSVSYDKFLPKFWTPEEDIHIQKIKLGSQRRPWYKKIQGFRCVRAYIYTHIYNPFFLPIYSLILLTLNNCMPIQPFRLEICDSVVHCFPDSSLYFL